MAFLLDIVRNLFAHKPVNIPKRGKGSLTYGEEMAQGGRGVSQ